MFPVNKNNNNFFIFYFIEQLFFIFFIKCSNSASNYFNTNYNIVDYIVFNLTLMQNKRLGELNFLSTKTYFLRSSIKQSI